MHGAEILMLRSISAGPIMIHDRKDTTQTGCMLWYHQWSTLIFAAPSFFCRERGAHAHSKRPLIWHYFFDSLFMHVDGHSRPDAHGFSDFHPCLWSRCTTASWACHGSGRPDDWSLLVLGGERPALLWDRPPGVPVAADLLAGPGWRGGFWGSEKDWRLAALGGCLILTAFGIVSKICQFLSRP